MIKGITKIQDSFALHFALLFGAVVAFTAGRPPYSNEWVYLLRLVRTYNDDFLLNDFSFSVPANEHWLFNHIFGVLTHVFSIEAIAWGGRITCWVVLLYAIIRLARHWELSRWAVAVGVFLWLCLGQATVAFEWILGTFEAKNIAYICLLFALDGFARERYTYPAILLGLTFSFHPAVGVWSVLACGLGLLCYRLPLAQYFKIAGLTAVFALPGLLPMLGDIAAPASAEDWKFVELLTMQDLLDPFSWSKTAIVLVYMQLAFCVMVYLAGNRSKGRRFLTAFVAALGLFFSLGFVLRGLEQYELLRSMPTRLLPVFIPLFFLWSLGEAYRQRLFAGPFRGIALLGFACLICWPNPLSTAANQVRQTYESWTTPLDGTALAYIWLGQNTPNGTVAIAPPWRQDLWYRSGRAQIASSFFPTYMSLKEWRERVTSLTGESLSTPPDLETGGLIAFYNTLPMDNVEAIAERGGAQYLITEGEYPYLKVFESGKTKVYRLRP